MASGPSPSTGSSSTSDVLRREAGSLGPPDSMDSALVRIDDVLARIERYADELAADPDGHVRRSAAELRGAFVERRAVEPAVARLRDSVKMLFRNNQDGSRREFHRRAPGLDHLEKVIAQELLPQLRRMSFDV